jgi:hypothetical protein
MTKMAVSVQATPGCVFREFLSQVPGAPDRGRSAALTLFIHQK